MYNYPVLECLVAFAIVFSIGYVVGGKGTRKAWPGCVAEATIGAAIDWISPGDRRCQACGYAYGAERTIRH